MHNSSNPTEAVILAGGLGTRLQAVVKDVPKPMAPVHGRPFLEHLILYWKRQGIERFTLSVGYLAEVVRKYLGSQFAGCELRYVVEEEPLGTGGAIRRVLASMESADPGLVILNGDTWYEVELREFSSFHETAGAPISIALRTLSGSDRYAGVELQSSGRISRFGVKSSGRCLINGGCYLMDSAAVGDKLANFPDKFSFEQDFLPQAAMEGSVAGVVQDQTFLDIGIPSDYQRAPAIIPTP